MIASAGANLPSRDAVDRRIIDELKNRTGRIINSQADVGGWPELKSADPPADADHDGMPDDWERARSLDPNDPSDGRRVAADPYTGAILAYASVPGYDANDYADAADSSPDLFADPIVSQVYEPGSVMKMLTSAAALENGTVKSSWS